MMKPSLLGGLFLMREINHRGEGGRHRGEREDIFYLVSSNRLPDEL